MEIINFSLYFLNFVVSAFLSGLFLVKKSENRLNKFWAFNTVLVSLFFLFRLSEFLLNDYEALFLVRLSFLILIGFFISYFLFILNFLNLKTTKNSILNFSYFFLASLGISILTPFFVKEVEKFNFPVNLEVGIFYYFAFLFSTIIIFYCLFLLLKNLNLVKGTKYFQIQYFNLSTILILSGCVINFIGPFFKDFWLLGNYLIFLGFLLASYILLKDYPDKIQIFYKKALIYLLIFGFVFLIYKINFYISQKFFGNEGFITLYLLPIFSSALIVLGFKNLESFLERILSSYFFREKYDYKKVLLQASELMTTILDLKHLLELIVRITMRAMKIDGACVLYFDEKIKAYYIKSARGKLKFALGNVLGTDNPLVEYLSVKKQPILYEALQEKINEIAGKNPEAEIFYKRIKTQMERIGAVLIIPGIFMGRLIGAFCLGEKKSKEPYTREDLELLTTLANQAAIAVENAKTFNENLSIKNFTELILGNIPQGAIVTNLIGEIIVFNKSIQSITGISAENALGTKLNVLFKDYPELNQLVELTITNKKVYIDDLRFFSKETNCEKILTLTSFLYEGNGDKEVIILVFDKTELGKAQEKIAEQEKLAEFGLIAGGIAHDIKNPLTGITAITQLLVKDFNNKANQEAFLEIMPKELERLKNILDSLSSYSREVKLKLKQTDINELLDNRLRLVEAVCLKNQIKIIREYDKLPLLLIDPDIMERVFQNIIFNAIQAMDKVVDREKVLKITTTLIREQLLGVKKESVIIKISDTGCGMDEKTAQDIFRPFFSTKKPGEGTGLGLALVEKYVKAHGGRITLETKLGEGTTFIINLPLVNEK